MGSAKVQMHLSVVWKKLIEMLISLSVEEMEKAQDLESSGDNFERKTFVLNSQILEVFQGSDVDRVVELIAVNLKAQSKNTKLPKGSFKGILKANRIMHLDIDFHKLELTRGSLHIELSK